MIQGVSLAFNASTLAPSPTWTRLDNGVTRVASYTIDRGRQFELDQTDGGRATVQINDIDGTLDPTNSAGPYYGKIEPLMQAGIARWNPVAAEWQTRFRGFVAELDYVFNADAWYVDNGNHVRGVNQLTMSLVDVFELLAQIPMMPGSFGDPPPAPSAGQVFFDTAPVDSRLRQIRGNSGLPTEFFVWFTGNVSLWETVYSPGETALAAVQEAVDAEWPGVSNFYPDRFGRGVFHGRLARFDPAGVAATTTPDVWDFRHWKAGDGRATRASLSDTAQIRRFAFNRGTAKVFNQALAAPMHAEELLAALSLDLSAQVSDDLTSQGLRGIRAWPPHQNLLTKTGLLDSSDALTETKRFGDFITLNFAEPRNRVTDLAFRPLPPGDTRAAPLWDLLCGVDIADQVDITVGSPGGGGFNLEPFFVEGIHEEVVGRLRQGVPAGGEGYDDVTVSLDVSPTGYFTTNPFPTS